jgi:hypothetical protein
MTTDAYQERAIRAAINTILQTCYKAESPIAALANEVQKLRAVGWPSKDVRQIEVAVLKMLVGMMTDDRKAADDTTMD